MYTAGATRNTQDLNVQSAPSKANAASPMARYAYTTELGEQGRDALASRAFVLSDVIAVMRLVRP